MKLNQILNGDCLDSLKRLPDNFVNTVITSPPYWGLRDYGMSGQIGLEDTVDAYVTKLVEVFKEVKRVLKDDGTLWLNLGDSYAGSGRGRNADGKPNPGSNHKQSVGQTSGLLNVKTTEQLKPKDLIGLPWRVAFALQADGWYLRQDIIWNKPNAMPESVRDRPTRSHEYIFLLTKSKNYFYDSESIKEIAVHGDPNPPRGSNGNIGSVHKGRRDSKPRGSFAGKFGKEAFRSIKEKRNKRSVWTVSTKPTKDAHFATFPLDLIEPCVIAGSPIDGIVLDPFFGSGTSGKAALKHNRNFIGIELNPEYIKIAEANLRAVQIELINEA
ncbi:adenine-specific methyltransferase [Bacillus sp. JCM 19046]|nr:adenine-specific methyltransferase [Bacillus sp. JCM 19045]GAF18918.1 adenine-specific methyltransferase [Bacillus sp. JCM 19046]